MRRLAQNLWPTLILAALLLVLTFAAPWFWSLRRPTLVAETPRLTLKVIEKPQPIREAFAEPPRLEQLSPDELSRLMERGPILRESDVERFVAPLEPNDAVLIPDPDDGQPASVYVALETRDNNPVQRDEEEPSPQMGDAIPLSQMMEATRETMDSGNGPPAMITQAAPPPVWPHAVALETQLERLSQLEPTLNNWTQAVKAKLTQLRNCSALGSVESQKTLQDLTELNLQGNRYAAGLRIETSRIRVMRVTYALNRRLAIWNAASQWAAQAKQTSPAINYQQWNAVYSAVFQKLMKDQAGSTWAKYLRVPEMRSLSSDGLALPEKRELARDVLRRLNSPQLTDDQLAFLQRAPFDLLTQQLLLFAAEPVHVKALLQSLESYESEELIVKALPIAEQYEIARWSIEPTEVKLAEELNSHYRNANFRIAISAELINRMLPKVNRSFEPVDDNIQGAAVQGESETEARLRLVLLPDRRRWRLGLEARGEVASSTSSTKGPATFYQDGYSSFRARKLLTIDRRNIRLFGAEAEANSENMLKDYETNYDGIPIFGSIARAIARQQYDEQSSAAKSEVENRIAGRASQQLDEEVNSRMQKAKTELQSKLLAPLQNLDLDPTAVDMETTSDRLIARYRLAGHEQLAANTPRPQAPGDSMLSVQVHQSAFNNLLQHLKLDGQQVELRKLYVDLVEMFGRKKVTVPEDIPENVMVTFAEHDSVRIDCEKGRVRLTIRLKELSHNGSRSWKDFVVRAYYVPDAEQLQANLIRDGVIELIGKNLRLGDQVALRGIFSKVLSRNRTVNLINEQIRQSKELSDLHVGQFAIQDGWVGVALASGPRQPIKPAATNPAEPVSTDAATVSEGEISSRPSISESMRSRR